MNPQRSALVAFLSCAGLYVAASIGTAYGTVVYLRLIDRLAAAPRVPVGEPSFAGPAYLYADLVQIVSAAVGFSAITAASRTWRSLRFSRLALLSLAAGALGEWALLTGRAHPLAYKILPGGHSLPLVLLRVMIPGLVLGLVALGVVQVLRLRRSKVR